MKNISFIISLILITVISFNTYSQVNVEIKKKEFRISDDGFKEAWKHVKGGNDYFEMGKGVYGLALEQYLAAYKFNDNNAELNYKIGICYLYSQDKAKSIDYLEKAYIKNNRVAIDILFNLGRGYHLTYQFDKAIEKFNAYKNLLSPKELKEELPKILRKIDECNVAKELVKKQERVFIDNIGSSINSEYRDYSPLISADESTMIITSRRENTTGGERDPRSYQYYEDIYISHKKSDDKWEPVKNIGKPLNTPEHDATVGLSPDGQQLFIFNSNNGGDIFVCKLKGDSWSKPKSISKYINTEYTETSASFSFSGNTVYFTSTRPEDDFDVKSKGGREMFYSEKDKKGRWGKVHNLSSVINSQYDEEGIFMHPDGRTLYFSSNGHNTMGGYDIFKSTLDDNGNWTKPINLGCPINTPDDDVFFVMAGSGRTGYYSSVRKAGMGGEDIYKITFLGPEKPLVQGNEDNLIASMANPVDETVIEKTVELKTVRLTILKGIVLDAITKQPLEAEIEIVDNELDEIVFTSSSNASTGKFLVSLPSGKNYGIAVKKEKYLFHSENINVPAATNYQEINKTIILAKMDVGSKIILKNIFFDYGKSTLRPASFPELDRLNTLLSEYSSIKIEISGHTDSKGSQVFNQKLSENRAKAVVDYLIKKGIKQDRLTYVGKDFQEPIATNDTEEGRQENRRVEFKVLSK